MFSLDRGKLEQAIRSRYTVDFIKKVELIEDEYGHSVLRESRGKILHDKNGNRNRPLFLMASKPMLNIEEPVFMKVRVNPEEIFLGWELSPNSMYYREEEAWELLINKLVNNVKAQGIMVK